MAADEALGWRAQLGKLREQVISMEKRRESEKRLERERNEESLRLRLKSDTPEALSQRFKDIHGRLDRAARRFYPLPHLEQALQELADFGELLRFYADCMKSFPKVFSANHKTGIPSLLGELGELQRGLDRQLGQWREVQAAMDKVRFRAKTPADDLPLVAVAKTFSDRAHKIVLSIPSDFFVREKDNFWVADSDGAVMGYVKYWPGEKVMGFALGAGENVNFSKFVRAVLHKFCAAGPLPEPLPSVRVHISFVREVKFFTDMGFARAETKGPSEWVYQRDLA